MDSWTCHRTMACDIIPWKLTLISLGSSFCRGRGDIFFLSIITNKHSFAGVFVGKERCTEIRTSFEGDEYVYH